MVFRDNAHQVQLSDRRLRLTERAPVLIGLPVSLATGHYPAAVNSRPENPKSTD